MEPLSTPQGNSGIGAQRATATYETKFPALQRREDFSRRHPEIDISAKRENGQLRFYAHEPGSPEPAVWTDVNQMMDDLEKRHSAAGPTEPDLAGQNPAELRRFLIRRTLDAHDTAADPGTRGLLTAQIDSLRAECGHKDTTPLLGTARQCSDCLAVIPEPASQPDQ